ncbi:DUF4259 domain-containing protein [Streptomyces sp. NPDC091292]|uniref:DUF4259 domain-containing protein n=1 Tax=Streptomyces sp. NPDC091292 TaxID=3365991 RepID=UPI00380C3015
MGTWDVGPFDNDTAGDWCDALDAATTATRKGIIRNTLARVIDTTGYLDASVSEEAVAAAGLVAAQCPGGEPADPDYGPEQPLPDLTGLRALAFQALDRVMTEPSELMALWAKSDGEPWQETINQLRATLQPQPPEAQLNLS